MEKSYFLSAEEPFNRFVEAFAAEVDTYLDGRKLGPVGSEDPAGMTWEEVQELEAFIDEQNKKKGRK